MTVMIIKLYETTWQGKNKKTRLKEERKVRNNVVKIRV
jgi:hypothetical protein